MVSQMQRQIYWWKRQGKIALLEQILRFQNRQWAGRCLCRGVLPTCLGGSENLRGPYTNPSFFGRIRVCFHSNQNLEEGRILPPGGPGSDGPVYLRRQNAAGETSETMLLLPTYSQTYVEYGNTDCGVFKQGYKIRKIFAKETTYPKEIIEFWDLY